MTAFKNIVIQYDEKMEETRVAGMHDVWNRAMIISDTGVPDEIRGRKIAVIKSASALERELCAIRQQSDKDNVKVMEYVNSVLGIAQFYKEQKAFENTDKNLIAVDVNNEFIDVCYIRNESGDFSIKKTKRLDCGINDIIEWMLESLQYRDILKEINDDIQETAQIKNQLSKIISNEFLKGYCVKKEFHYVDSFGEQQFIVLKRQDIMSCIQKLLIAIMESINILLYQEQIKDIVIMLSGKIWLCQEAVQILKKRYVTHQIVSYRPEVAALLGAVIYLNLYAKLDDLCLFENNYEKMHYKDIWGRVNRLNQIQQEGYWKVLQKIIEGKREILIQGEANDIYDIYSALRIDFPEICIVWAYDKSSYYTLGTKESPYVQINLTYKKEGENTLSCIDEKANKILKKCVYNYASSSDAEIIRRIYLYISENYYYVKQKNENGEYPDYAYTLETLLYCGVCHGYATTLIYLLKKLQIPIFYVGGDADGREFGGHAWNMVQIIDGSYRHMDITWDLEKAQKSKEMGYYLLDDIEMKARRHFWNVQDYPVCI